jgi:hypothetical protein
MSRGSSASGAREPSARRTVVRVSSSSFAQRGERCQAFDQQRLEAVGIATNPQLTKFWQTLQEALVAGGAHVGDVQGNQHWQLCQRLDMRGRRRPA